MTIGVPKTIAWHRSPTKCFFTFLYILLTLSLNVQNTRESSIDLNSKGARNGVKKIVKMRQQLSEGVTLYYYNKLCDFILYYS